MNQSTLRLVERIAANDRDRMHRTIHTHYGFTRRDLLAPRLTPETRRNCPGLPVFGSERVRTAERPAVRLAGASGGRGVS